MGDFLCSIEGRKKGKSKNFMDSVYLWLANKNNNKESKYFSFSQFVKKSCFFTINISKNTIVDFHVCGISSPIEDSKMSHMNYEVAYKNLVIYNVEDDSKQIASDFFDREKLIEDYEEGITYREEYFNIYIGSCKKKHKICVNRQMILKYDTKDIYAFFLLLENKNDEVYDEYEIDLLFNSREDNSKEIRRNDLRSAINDSNIDGLTKLNNIYKFKEIAKKKYDDAIKTKTDEMFSLLFIDVNGFKYFNEEYSFLEGDLFLKYIAEQLVDIFESQTVARLYDDHFAVFTNSMNVIAEVIKLNNRVKKYHENEKVYLKVGIYCLENPSDRKEIYNSSSYGKYSDINVTDKDILNAIDKAKLACQNVKSRYDLTYCYYDDKVAKKEKKEHYIITSLDKALENKYIEVYFQPIIRTLTRELCGWESLTRWNDPIYGSINPDEFITVLEKAHLIHKIDIYVIKYVCQKYVELKKNNEIFEPISVNLSRLDFEMCDILEIIEQEVKKSGIPKALIHFEITESIISENVEVINKKIKQIHDAGYQVWMDDFGSGYSSFNALKDFNFDFLKIDMNFLKDFDSNEKSKVILASIVNMAKQLSMGTLAEGVETEKQVEFLHSIGCEKMQGFLFGKPLPYNDAIENIEKNNIQKEVGPDVAYNVIINRINLLNSNPLMNINVESIVRDDNLLRDYKKEFNEKTNFAFSSGFPLAVVEYHRGAITYIIANEEYLKFIKDLGTDTLSENEDFFNRGLFDRRKDIISIGKSARLQKEEKSIDLVKNGYLCNLKINYIATNIHRKTHAYLISVAHSLYDVGFEKGKWLNVYTKMLYSMFVCIDLVDFKDNRIENLYYNGMNINRRIIDNKLDITIDEFIRKSLYPKEKDEFLSLFKPDDLKIDFKGEQISYKERFFRVKRTDNTYDWFTFWLMYQKRENGTQCVLFIKNSSATTKKLLESKKMIKGKDYSKNKINDEVLRNVLEFSDIGVFWKDRNRRFIDVNDNFMNFYGITDKDLIIGKTDEEMGWHINEDGPKMEELKVIKEGESIINHKVNCIVKGSVHELIVNKRPIYVDGKIVGLVGGFKDNFYDESASLTINKLAVTDELTELFNRRGFIEMLDKYEREYNRKNIDFVLFYIDIDDFKYFNDTFGHQFGDKVLKTVSKLLKGNYGNNSVIARIGGDEFAIISQYHEEFDLNEFVKDIQGEINTIKKIDYIPCKIRLSIGFSKFSETISLNKLINVADVRMYENKMRKKKINNEIEQRKHKQE